MIQLTPDTSEIRIGEAENYVIKVLPARYRLVVFSYAYGTAGFRFRHPNLVKVQPAVLYYVTGRDKRKRCVTKPGVDLYFVVPSEAISVEPKAGYSYVHASVNGQPITFDVTGCSTLPKGWTDYLTDRCSVCVGTPVKAMKAAAEVAIPRTMAEDYISFDGIDADPNVVSEYLALVREIEGKKRLRPGHKVRPRADMGQGEVLGIDKKRRHVIFNYNGQMARLPYRALDWQNISQQLGIYDAELLPA